LGFAFADSPQGDGESNQPDASGGRDFLLHTAKPKTTKRPVADAPALGGLLEEAASMANLARALLNVVSNKGAPGPDGQSVEAAEQNARPLLSALRKALLKGSYRPGEVRRVTIPKPGGGRRDLGIPNVVDRVAQQAVLQVLEPIFEPTFHPSSHGFRRGRGAPTAIAEAKAHRETGRQWVVDIDLSKFFDRVDHQRLLDRLALGVGDARLVEVVRRMLKAKVVLPDGVKIEPQEGTPQGGPLSPLVSNIVLDELDWELARRGHRFVRYADDCNVFVGSERAGQRVMASLRDFLERRMRLKVNVEKSAVRKASGVHFLGFRLARRGAQEGERIVVLPSAKAEKRLKATIRAMTPPNWGRSLADCMADLSRYLNGWMAHFRLCSESALKGFGTIEAHIRRRLRAIIIQQKKRRRFLYRHLLARGVGVKDAGPVAYGRKGRWVRSNYKGMTKAYPPAWFKSRMTSLAKRWRELNAASASGQLAFAL
jgi:RNA-directed DNA polymerase